MSKKGKRLREFEKNNREFNISEAQRQRQERDTGRREREKSSKVLAAESPTFRARPTSEEKRRIK